MITISSCGYNSRHLKPCDIEHKNGLPEYLLLIVKKEAWFILDERKTVVLPNTVIIFTPGTYIHYGCDSPNYNDDWMHFHFQKADSELLTTLKIPFNEPISPAQIQPLSYYVQLITDAFHSNFENRAIIQDLLTRTFFYTLADERNRTKTDKACHKYYSSFCRIRTEIYNTPPFHWSVAALAKSLCISISYFQHLYKSFFSCSLYDDIIKSRHQQAKFYLRTSNMSIKSLSEFCGYESDIYFMRQFKKHEGLTPTEYRKSFFTDM